MSNGRCPLPAADDLSAATLADKPGSVLRELFAPLDRLLAGGGDARLAIDPATGTNAYFARPQPCPDALEFCSSTATSISARGFEAAGRARDALMQAAISDGIADAFDARIEAMRGELRAHLGLDAGVEVIFSASGTDAQLQALYLGRAVLGPRLTTLVVAADQTGSGTVFTARGQHFGEITASGLRVAKAAPLDGLATGVDSIAVPLRDAAGDIRTAAAMDQVVSEALTRVTTAGGRVLLQAMDCSKLGWRAPSDALLDDLATQTRPDVLVVIDACQMRLSRRRIGWYLDREFLVLITGSKYFTAPPFCGALLVPPRLAQRIAACDIDLAGLACYSNQSDWPRQWTAACAALPTRPNFGQWLRWEAALAEIGAYFAVPDAFRRMALATLGGGIARMIAASPYLRLLPLPSAADVAGDDEMALPTIFGFTLHHHDAALSLDTCKAIHRALAIAADDRVRPRPLFATTPCVVGQPVEWRDADGRSTAALRLCLSARHVTEAFAADPALAQANLERLLDQVAIAIIKIETLLRQHATSATPEVSHGPCAR